MKKSKEVEVQVNIEQNGYEEILVFVLDNISSNGELQISEEEFADIGFTDLDEIEEPIKNLMSCTAKITEPGEATKQFDLFSSIKYNDDIEQWEFCLTGESLEYKELILKFLEDEI